MYRRSSFCFIISVIHFLSPPTAPPLLGPANGSGSDALLLLLLTSTDSSTPPVTSCLSIPVGIVSIVSISQTNYTKRNIVR